MIIIFRNILNFNHYQLIIKVTSNIIHKRLITFFKKKGNNDKYYLNRPQHILLCPNQKGDEYESPGTLRMDTIISSKLILLGDFLLCKFRQKFLNK